MKIQCTVCVVNRLLPNLPAAVRKKPCKSTLALCKHPKSDEFCLLLFSGQNKAGTKYSIKNNIKHVLTRFINEGKCTIQLKSPEHDLCIQGDPLQIKGFIHLLKRAIDRTISDKELTYSSMSVTPIKSRDTTSTKLTINKRSDYPLKGFPRTLESLYINDIQRSGLDKGILQLNRLKILNLSNNLIEHLPEELNRLPNLNELNVSHNLLGKSSLQQWQWIGGCLSKSLHLLDVTYNELTFVPDQIVKLYNITTLHLSYNRLVSLPVGIGSLKHLKIFSASNNLLTILPGSVKKLRLQSIDISNNNFAQNMPNGAGIYPKPLQVRSLKECAGKKVLWARIPYPKGTLPITIIDYLDNAKYCVCGKACFNVFVRQTHNLLLSSISETVCTVANDEIFVPIDCYFCSLRCFSLAFYNRNRNPIVR
ncbi:leucine-rich repeat protein 1 [Euwallacea similis]|uniref:leucine-rich repeat protein 1 n=1 Tax=Euwallacea similis TaxID=1736056 RepID=UPI00344F3606